MALSTDDIVAIEQLYARYNHTLDFGDAEGWANCYTPDGVFASGQGTQTGTEALRQFAEGFAKNMGGKFRHWNSNLLIEPSDSGAKGSVYLLALMTGGDPKVNPLTTAVYQDELVKENGEWRFKSRTVVADG